MTDKVWRIAKPITENGIYTGRLVRLQEMPDGDTYRVLLRLDGEMHLENIKSSLPLELYKYLYKDELEAAGCVQTMIYLPSWSDPDLEDKDAVSINTLLSRCHPGDIITIRVAKSWKGKRTYIRYLEKLQTGEHAGNQDSFDWRQNVAPRIPYRKDEIKGKFTVSYLTPVTNDDGEELYSVEIAKSTDTTFGVYRAYIRQGSKAWNQASELFEEKNLIRRKMLLTIHYDAYADVSFITDMQPEDGPHALADKKKNEKKKSTRKKSEYEETPYAEQKKIADQYPKLEKSEYDITGGIYHGIIRFLDGIEYWRKFCFIGIELDDGMVIAPELRSSRTKGYGKVADNENLALHKKALENGMRVKVYMEPTRTAPYLYLKALVKDAEYASADKEIGESLEDIFE